MKLPQKIAGIVAASATALAVSGPVQAADEVNIAFFLEWATPNMIAKVEQAYDEAMGVKVNWTNFDAGTQMTEAMLSGDIDISYSQGLAPFITGVNGGAPIKTVGIAVGYPANPCIIKSGSGISMDNASELEGKKVAVPLNTMADYSFRKQMEAVGVDPADMTVVDQIPADGAVALADGSVDMVCLFGGNAIKKAMESGEQFMSDDAMANAGIISFDVVSVTDAFAQENPDMVKAFLDVTHEANAAFAADQSKLDVLAAESGMDEETTKNQMAGFVFPTAEEQLSDYFSDGGLASQAISFVGSAFATDDVPALDDYSKVVDTSFLK